MSALSVFTVPGLPEVTEGDDVGRLVADACRAAGVELRDDDIVTVASKIVAKAEGRSVPASEREAAIARETVRVVAEREQPDGRVTRVVETRTGPVMAAAGVDASDVAEGTVLLLPAEPDASARRIRASLAAALGARPAVVVTDTSGRPWRMGVSDFALGAAGLTVLDDTRGRLDRFGRPLEVTVRAIADEVAATADLVKGKAAGTPVAVVRGLGRYVVEDDGDGARVLVRTGESDWFRYGHVEAVRAYLGSPPGGALGEPGSPAPAVHQTGAAAAVDPGGTMPVTPHLLNVFVAERPWGQFQQLVENQRVTVKIITVQPGHRLSLQRHGHRDEMWQALDVPMAVTVDDRSWTLEPGEMLVVPAGSLHRLGNDSDRPGRVLEIAFGEFDEADIERLEDDYAR